MAFESIRRLRANACLLVKRLESTRNGAVALKNQGMSLALMNIALTVMATDLVAHELKTPLNNLIGKAQVTLVRERSKEQYREVLESSVEELERMDRIVSDMLFLGQASHASPALKLEQLSLGSEANRVCEYLEVLAEEADAHGVGGLGQQRRHEVLVLVVDLHETL